MSNESIDIELRSPLDAGPSALAATRAAATYRPRHLSVLVVEPAADDVALIDHALRRMPWFEAHVTVAGTAEAGRFALRAADVDVALIACDDAAAGLDFARELLGDGEAPPVILTSKCLDTETEYDAIGFGVAACIGKDEITPRVLENYIRQALWRRAAVQQLTALPVHRQPESAPAQPRGSKGDKVLSFTRPYTPPRTQHATFDLQDLVVEQISAPRFGIAVARCKFEARPLIVRGDRTLLGRVVATALEHAADGITALRMSATAETAVLEIDQAGLATAFGDRLATMQAAVVRAHGGAIEHLMLGKRGSRLRLTLPLAAAR